MLAQPARTPAARLWSESEGRFLVAASQARVPIAEIARRLDRSRSDVRRRRRAVAVNRSAPRRYTAQDDANLARALAAGMPPGEVANMLGRSEGAVRLRARAQGLLAGTPRRRWQSADDRCLRYGYRAGLSAGDIRRTLLPTRSEGAIVARARLLGLAVYARRWSAQEEATLRRLSAEGMTAAAAGELLGRSGEAVAIRARRIGHPMTAPCSGRASPWTAADDDLLRRRPRDHMATLAQMLGRSEASIRRRRRLLQTQAPAARTQHHPYNGEQAEPAVERLLARHVPLTPGRALSLSRRLGIPLPELQRLARRAAAEPGAPC